MYRAIIFDFFGVIQADPYQRWLNKHNLKREGEFAEASDMADKNLITWQEFFNKLNELSGEPVESIREAFYEDKTIDEELIKFIKTLKNNYKISLLSNSSSDYLRPILAGHGILDLFDIDIVSSEVGVIKPDPEIFELALGKLGTAPEETIFIDDRSYNTEAAARLGIKSILYRDLVSLKEELRASGITFR
ncbi:MAG TPA: HAD family phosphatase [Candidatus Saccharimonadales bacterium]|nr:HAD family phosphatase [Candidatus Saccharimonadales bacterium]